MANNLIVFMASYLYLIIILLAIVVFLTAGSEGRLALAARAIVALPLAYLLAKLSGALIVSPRPFVVEQIQPLIKASTDNGFPSDHALLAMAAAMLIFTFSRKAGSFLLLLAVGVAAGRVLTHAHHPIDVIGSAVIALVAVAVAVLIEPGLKSLARRAGLQDPTADPRPSGEPGKRS